MIRGVVFTHVDLGKALCEVVESFVGPQEDLVNLSNHGLNSDQMTEALKEVVKSAKDGVLIFTTLYGGSCWQAAERLKKEYADIHHITGTNLPMLLAFVNKRESIELDKLVGILPEYGREGIRP